MSNPNGPVRRRRIAGENKPAVEPVKAKAKSKLPPKPAKAPSAKTPKRASAPKPAVAPKAKGPAVAKPVKTTKVATAPAMAQPPVETSSEPRKPVPKKLIALMALAVAAVVFAAIGIFIFNDVSHRGADFDKAQAQASTKAGEAAERIFTYQWDKLPEHTKASKELMTPSFRKEFDTIAPAMTKLAPQRKIVVMAQARSVAPIECGNDCASDEASVLVFLDQARLVDGSKTPTVFGNRVVVEMVKADGAWLVDNIRAL